MKVPVLKAFPYAHDGANLVQLQAGEVHEIHDDLIPGLEAEGYVGEPGSAAASSGELVEIPDDWRDLHWFKQMAIAKRLSGAAVSNKAAASAIIEAELALRA